MKKHLLMMTTAVAIGAAAPVVAQDDFAGFADGIVALLGSQGATVSFDARNIGADGSVEYVGFWMSAPEGEMTVQADWIKGVPSATTPGQVTFTMSPSASITFIDPDTGEHVINVSNDGLVVTLDGITSGQNAETLDFSAVANSLGISSGNPNDTVIKALDLNFTNFSQTVSFSPASMLLRGVGTISLASLIYDIDMQQDGQMGANGQTSDLRLAFQLVANDDERNILDYLSGVTTAFVELSAGPATSTAKLYGPDARIAYSGTASNTNIMVRAEDGQFSLVEEIGATRYSFSEFNVEGMPLPPFDVALESASIKLQTPTVDRGKFEEATAVFALRGIEISESIYSMFDPGQAVTRSPINAVIDVSANVRPNIDWSNPDAAFNSGNPADIGAVQDITINEVLFTAGGAEITAEGGATIDNSMGFPFPTGKVTVTAAGVQALVNGLVSLGFIPQDQAGMAMGMMMAFARPGETADEFISDIEFSPQGITANGVPLPM